MPKGAAPESTPPDFRSVAIRVLLAQALALAVLAIIQFAYRVP